MTSPGRPTPKALVGSAGEHYVLYKLHRQGLLSAPAPRGFKDVDILVLNPDLSVIASIQVKTSTHGPGWVMGEKHEGIVLPGLFYCFVDFKPAEPVTYVVPCSVVADFLRKAHRAWLGLPGKRGESHKDNPVRRVQPAYNFPVAGFEPGWMDQYRENWALLDQTAAPPMRAT